jgi:ParB family chromosome partitioning protein
MNNEEVVNLPISRIHVLNSRPRDQQKFECLVDSIKTLGLKKPVTVSVRSGKKSEEDGYDLVCGEGRMLALKALGYAEVPAIVIDISKNNRLLMGLVENIARHPPALVDLINEVERLKSSGLNHSEIGKRIGISGGSVTGYLALKNAGEERVLRSVLQGKIPVGIGQEIAQADTAEKQATLLKAYESKLMNLNSIRSARSLINSRNCLGKSLASTNPGKTKKEQPTAEQLVDAVQKEHKRQKLFVRNARNCERHLSFVTGAFRRLFADREFMRILKNESLDSLPKPLAEQLKKTPAGR